MTLQTTPVLTPPPAPAAPLPVPHVRAGSHYDAKRLRGRIQQLLAAVDRADGQLRVLCQQARDKKIFLVLEDPRGRYFPDWTAFVTAPQPWGLGLDGGLVDALVEEARDPARRARLMLASDVVVGRQGVRSPRRLAATERGAQYKLARLKRDHPDVLERLARGELPSLKAAWAAAGFRTGEARVFLDPMNVARVVVTRLPPAAQREVVELLQHPERITAPPRGRTSAAWRAFDEARTTPEERARREAERAARYAATRAAIDARKREQRRAAREAQAAA